MAVLMTLADRYSVDSLLNKCEVFLVKNKTTPLFAKLMLVDRLNFVHIKASRTFRDCDLSPSCSNCFRRPLRSQNPTLPSPLIQS